MAEWSPPLEMSWDVWGKVVSDFLGVGTFISEINYLDQSTNLHDK